MIALFIGMQAFVKHDLVEGQAPLFSATTIEHKPFQLSDLQGQPTLLYFWASWCGICDAMDGTIDRLSQDYPLMTVAMQSGDGATLAAFMQGKGLEFPVIADEDGSLSSRYGVKGVPTLFVLDDKGAIQYSSVGFTSSWGIRARLWLAGLLQ